MNVLNPQTKIESVADLFKLLAQPARLQILLVLDHSEACVCHLEVALGLRQAYISQQLMVLRDAGLVTTIRDGRNVYYRLAQTGIVAIIHQAVKALGEDDPSDRPPADQPLPGCPCPRCAVLAGLDPSQAADITCDQDEGCLK